MISLSPREQARVEGALKAQRDRPGHDYMPVLAPRDVESPAVELDGCPAPGEAPSVRRDKGGAGAAAAGAGDPGPALPHPQTDIPAFPNRRDADVRALGKQRVVLEIGPSAARSIASTSATKKVACGLPMLVQTGAVSAPSASSTRSVGIARASGISRQPVRAGPISTADAAVRQNLGVEQSGNGLDSHPGVAGLLI